MMANSFSGMGPESIVYVIGEDGQINKVEGVLAITINENGVVIVPLAGTAGIDTDKGITIDVNWNS